MYKSKLTIYCDGGARGNPGPAAVGIVIIEESRLIAQFGKVIGVATNNTAEYQAVIAALKFIVQRGLRPTQINFYLDSLVVRQQLSGKFKVKQAHLKQLLAEVRNLETQISANINYTVVPREKNLLADRWVNQALDQMT